MRASEIKQLIITLLSSARTTDGPRHCVSLTPRQICNHIEALVPPDQQTGRAKALWNRVVEQLELLESEFEVTSKGDARKTYRMAHPVLIIESEVPLRLKYVGDRAYFDVVVELLGAQCDTETWLLETVKTDDEAREILEARGITVQTEQMLFQFLPEPALPTEIELSIAEQLSKDDLGTDIKVYIPRRMDFFIDRWANLDDALPSEMSRLRRVKTRQILQGKHEEIYFWETEDRLYRLSKDQAILASYRIDLDRNESRLLDLNRPFPAQIRKELPSAYRALLDRYTAVVPEPSTGKDRGIKCQQFLEVKFRHRDFFSGLIEAKLGINKPLT